MGAYESTTTVEASPDELFAYLSDVNNLPEYFAAMKSAEPAGQAEGSGGGTVPPGAEAVHSVAVVDGQRREGEAWFQRDADTRSLRWGSEGPNDYHGELRVDGDGDGSRVTVSLHTEHAEGDRIQEGLETTLAQIKDTVEGRGRTNPS
ncbi:MAG TPA: SRPBCC family protein [Pseudonocardia sp.]|jgi:uncharacterized protein YndB with AHSA1/START domain